MLPSKTTIFPTNLPFNFSYSLRLHRASCKSARRPPSHACTPTKLRVLVYEQTTLLLHTGRANIEAVVSVTPSAFVIYYVIGVAVDKFSSLGGVYGDCHSILCTICMVSVELLCVFIHKFEKKYMLRHLLVQWPCHIIYYTTFSCLVFDWRPADWTDALMTVTVVLSNADDVSPRPSSP